MPQAPAMTIQEDALVFASVAQRCRTKYLRDISDEERGPLKEIAKKYYRFDARALNDLLSTIEVPPGMKLNYETTYIMFVFMANTTFVPGPGSNGIVEINWMILGLLNPLREDRDRVLEHLRVKGFLEWDVVKKVIEFSQE
ncbi:hypothetical protein MVEG_04898 [Podila verticillata NRRL 6337]|nr:hypothetical protein MVEG_04898 [Podila verticillata NRRL 6337]